MLAEIAGGPSPGGRRTRVDVPWTASRGFFILSLGSPPCHDMRHRAVCVSFWQSSDLPVSRFPGSVARHKTPGLAARPSQPSATYFVMCTWPAEPCPPPPKTQRRGHVSAANQQATTTIHTHTVPCLIRCTHVPHARRRVACLDP